MTREQAREELKGQLRAYVESITTKSQGANMYVCPLCGSGTGSHGTGAFSVQDGLRWKCFSCNEGGDIFDLIGKYEGIEDYNAQLQRAGELFGIDVENQNQPKSEQYTHTHIHTPTYTQEEEGEKESLVPYFRERQKHLKETSYLTERGISEETATRFMLGYDPHYTKGTGGKEWKALIIPTGHYSYVARNTDPQAEKSDRYRKAGSSTPINTKALQTATKPIFIVEGELDALSIIEVGGEAIGLGSTANVKVFVDNYIKKQKPEQPLIIALDNDEQGVKASEELARELEELGVFFYRLNPAGEYKDANEALQRDREAFRQAVEVAEHIQEEEERAQKEAYLKTSTAYYLDRFIDGIADSVNTPYIPTGYPRLDAVLEGGLYEGLYIVGAISSLGKTTLITQIADQIAQTGQDVLIFSLEMARTELMAKSISRHTLQKVLETGGDLRNAKTTRGITTGKRYEGYNSTELNLITDAIDAYGKYADHIYISEGIGDIGVEQIRETVKKHILYTGSTPVVVIDYLQILAPYSERSTDKQNTDKAVMELKRISRDYKTPVIGISSFNRANYREAVTMEAFKESGAIEYSSDVLIGLQLKGAGSKNFDYKEALRENPREVELVILKNRNGKTGEKIEYSYYPLFNYFEEGEGGQAWN